MSNEPQPLPIVCTLDEVQLAARREGDIGALLASVQSSRELDDGYELTLPGDADTVRAVAAFIVNERECCRFFTFEAVFAPDGGPVAFRLRGPEGTKELLANLWLQSQTRA